MFKSDRDSEDEVTETSEVVPVGSDARHENNSLTPLQTIKILCENGDILIIQEDIKIAVEELNHPELVLDALPSHPNVIKARMRLLNNENRTQTIYKLRRQVSIHNKGINTEKYKFHGIEYAQHSHNEGLTYFSENQYSVKFTYLRFMQSAILDLLAEKFPEFFYFNVEPSWENKTEYLYSVGRLDVTGKKILDEMYNYFLKIYHHDLERYFNLSAEQVTTYHPNLNVADEVFEDVRILLKI